MPVKQSNAVLWVVMPCSFLGCYSIESGEYTFLRNVGNSLQDLHGVSSHGTTIDIHCYTKFDFSYNRIN
jgi:hypothetical protein